MSLFAKKKPRPETFGVLAEFEDEHALIEAIQRGRSLGYTRMEAYTPMPSHHVIEALGHKNRLPQVVFLGGLLGAIVGFSMQYWMSAVNYPIDIGGRPYNSWPSFIVVTFEMTILFAAFAAVFGMLAMNGLPKPYHPVFHIEEFKEASSSKFFLLVVWYDPRYDAEEARSFLQGQSPTNVFTLPH